MYRGKYTIDGGVYIFDNEGVMLTGWVHYSGDWYYCTSKGAYSGWKKIGKKWYYFSPYSNYMLHNTVTTIEGVRYVFGDSGAMCTGWAQPYRYYGDTTYYYCKSNGEVVTGWKKIGKKWYYFDPNYSGAMSIGFKTIRGETGSSYNYFFNQNGVMQTGWVQPSENYYGAWYYFDNSGRGVNGWKKFSGKWYYFTQGNMNTGETYIDGKYYYFQPYQYDSSGRQVGTLGAMKTGWVNFYYYSDGQAAYKYYSGDGSRVQGWKKISGKWYYFDPSNSGYMVVGFRYIYDSSSSYSGAYYYFSNSGAMKTGWLRYNGYYYYMTSSGAIRESWKKIGKKWYYFDSNSHMVTGYYWIDGVIYHFAEDGHCYNPNAHT